MTRRHRCLAIAAALAASAGLASADTVTLTLTNGDTVNATLVAQTDDGYTIDHPVLGTLTIPVSSVESAIVTPDPDTPDAPADAEEADEQTTIEAEEESPWEVELSFGLNGTAGSTQTENIRLGAAAKRTTESNETSLNLSYHLARDEGDNTENRFELRGRHDYLFEDSPWRAFAQASFVDDQFQDFNQQYRGNAGVGYEFINNDDTFLLGRFGAGAVYETDADPEELSPELLFALEYEHAITDNSNIALSTEVYPDLRNDAEPRITNRGSYDITLSEEKNLSLRLGAEHRYNPQEENRNEVDYFVLLVYAF